MKSIAVTAFRARCLSLLEDVARTGEPLLVTKRGKPLARIVASGEWGAHPQISLAGTVTVVGDLIEPVVPASAWDAMRGDSVASPSSLDVSRKSATVRRARKRFHR